MLSSSLAFPVSDAAATASRRHAAVGEENAVVPLSHRERLKLDFGTLLACRVGDRLTLH
jgi:hypothetical protein